NERQEALDALYAEVWRQDRSTNKIVASGPPANGTPHGLTDDEILCRARTAANGDKFRRLWGGDTGGYVSPSEADLSLCSLLAFWTGPDAERIDRLFRKSGLMREKWTR